MSVAQDFLEELLQLLSDEENESSPEELMEQVVSIVDDYKSELDLDKAENDQREMLAMMGVDPDEEDEESESEDDDSDDDDSVAATNKPINRAFLLDKARKDYYRKLGLSQDDIDDLSPAEKIKHREGVTKLFNKMVREAVSGGNEEDDKPSKVAKGPFKSSVKRVVDEDEEEEDDEEDDEVGAAHQKWNRKRKLELKREIRQVEAEIDELKRQNKIKKISPSIVNRNLERIDALEEELEELEEQLERYK